MTDIDIHRLTPQQAKELRHHFPDRGYDYGALCMRGPFTCAELMLAGVIEPFDSDGGDQWVMEYNELYSDREILKCFAEFLKEHRPKGTPVPKRKHK